MIKRWIFTKQARSFLFLFLFTYIYRLVILVSVLFLFIRFLVADFNNPLGKTLESCSQLPLFVLFIYKHEQNKSKRKADQFRFLGNWAPTPPLSHHFAQSEK